MVAVVKSLYIFSYIYNYIYVVKSIYIYYEYKKYECILPYQIFNEYLNDRNTKFHNYNSKVKKIWVLILSMNIKSQGKPSSI